MVKHCIVPGCTNKYNSCKSVLEPAPDGSRMALVPACSPAAKRGVLNHADTEFSRCHNEDSGSLPFYHLAIRGGKRGFTLSVEPTYLEASTSMSVAPTGQGTADRPTTRPHRCFSGALQRSRGPHVSLGLPAVAPVTSTSVPETQPSTVTETRRATEAGPATETQSETQTAMETQLVTETQPETQPSTETQPTTETQPGTQLSGPEEEPRSATFLVDDVDYECDTTRAQASSKVP